MRTSAIERKTKETDIKLSLSLDGGEISIDTGIGFFDHMLNSFATHGGFGLKVSVKGDLHVDEHHTVEDTGIVLGKAFAEALGDKGSIERFGSFYVPMDEALAFASVDVSGRPFLVFDAEFPQERCGGYDCSMTVEFMRALAFNAGTSLVCSNLVSSVTPLTATALTLPESSSVPLTISGSVLADGVYSLISLTSGTIPDSYTNFVVFGTALGTKTSRLLRSADKKTLLLAVDVPAETDACIWTGEGDGESFSDAGNWMNGDVPSNGGETVHFPTAAGALDNDLQSFAPQSIVFGAGIGALTIGGNSIAGLHAVTNLSTAANAVFTAPVEYAEGKTIATFHGGAFDNSNAKFSKELGLVIFKGGVTGYELMGNSSGSHNIYAGEYRRTNPAAYTATVSGSNYRRAIYKNSSLTVASAGNTTELFIGKGGAFTTAVQTITSRLYLSNGGEYVVNGKLTTGASECNAGYNSSVYAPANDGAVIKVGSLTIPGAGAFGLDNTGSATTNTWFIGEEGMNVASGKDGFFFTRFAGSKVTIRPWRSDFTVHAGSTAPGDIYIGAGSQTGGTVEFLTEDESGEARTITIAGRLAAREAIKSSAHIVVSGTGKVALDSVSAFYGDTKVKGGATLAIKPGAGLGESAMTVNTGATLAVEESAAVTISGATDLKDGAVLSFNFTSIDAAPKFVFSNKATASGTVKVKVSAADGVFPRKLNRRWLIAEGVSGEFELDEETKPIWADGVSVEGGNLYLDVKAPGLTLSVR